MYADDRYWVLGALYAADGTQDDGFAVASADLTSWANGASFIDDFGGVQIIRNLVDFDAGTVGVYQERPLTTPPMVWWLRSTAVHGEWDEGAVASGAIGYFATGVAKVGDHLLAVGGILNSDGRSGQALAWESADGVLWTEVALGDAPIGGVVVTPAVDVGGRALVAVQRNDGSTTHVIVYLEQPVGSFQEPSAGAFDDPEALLGRLDAAGDDRQVVLVETTVDALTMWRSTDQGRTWSTVTVPGPPPGLSVARVFGLTPLPQGGTVLGMSNGAPDERLSVGELLVFTADQTWERYPAPADTVVVDALVHDGALLVLTRQQPPERSTSTRSHFAASSGYPRRTRLTSVGSRAGRAEWRRFVDRGGGLREQGR